MEKKLRKKFVYFSVGVFSIVLFTIGGYINFSNFYQIKHGSDSLLQVLTENDGQLPKFKNKSELESFKNKISPEMTFSNRFFTVKTDISKNVITVNTGDVYLTSANEAVQYAKDVLNEGKQTGYIGNFKYLVSDKDYGILVVFVDLTRDFD